MKFTDFRGAREALLTERFFVALGAGDAPALIDLLDDSASMENIDGPVAAVGAQLAHRLAGHGPGVEYRLEEVELGADHVVARFTLLVADVPGAIGLEADLRFAGGRIMSIVVRQP